MPHPAALSTPFTTYLDFETRLKKLGQFRMVPGLERIGQALDSFDLRRPARCQIQVVGTNGKGSTCAFLESLARAHGFRTGLYASPHFASVRERARVNGAMLGESPWLEAARATQGVAAELQLTYFEWVTLIGAWLFRKEQVEVAVIEAGLGGRFDATTALEADVLVMTPIDLDHQSVLGSTLEAIAADKAGAMRTGRPVVSARQAPEAEGALRRAARERQAPLSCAGDGVRWRDGAIVRAPDSAVVCPAPRLRLPGAHQRRNSLLALEAWMATADIFGWKVDPGACCHGLETAWLPGRFQRIAGRPEFILDGAHNPAGMRVLNTALGDLDIRPKMAIFSCLKDKDVGDMARELLALTEGPIMVPGLVESERILPAPYLAWLIGDRAEALADVPAALERTRRVQGPVVVCGSLFLLAEVFRLRPEWLEIDHG